MKNHYTYLAILRSQSFCIAFPFSKVNILAVVNNISDHFISYSAPDNDAGKTN
jgi:hypothetical protein